MIQKEDSFNLSEAPTIALSQIAEKMEYRDFANFNVCSRLSAVICKRVPPCVRHVFRVNSISMEENASTVCVAEHKHCRKVLMLRNVGRRFDLKEVPSNVQISCDELHISRRARLEEILKYGIRTSSLSGWMVEEDNRTLLQIIQLTQPKDIWISTNIEKMQIEDSVLLKSDVPNLQIVTTTKITIPGFIEYLKQWMRGDRDIKRVLFTMKELDVNILAKHFGEGLNMDKESPQSVHLCRNNSHNDCLFLKVEEEEERGERVKSLFIASWIRCSKGK